MVSVILIWIYMMVTTYLTGFGIWSLLSGREKYAVKKEDSFIFIGVAAVTVYAQIFSIFTGVGLAANLVLIAICGAIALGMRTRLKEHFHSLRLTVSPVRIFISFLLFLLFAFGASRGMIHYDTGLYHAQSIRWIEEYGSVAGLGNLHVRLAYNSASFCLSALYSLKFLGGQSFHAAAGFVAFWVAKACLDGIRRGKARKVNLSDLARVTAVYYVMIIFDEMISPASDYFCVLLVFYCLIRWLDLLEAGETSYLPFALLGLLCVFITTVKFSAALLMLLALKPLLMLLKPSKALKAAAFIGLGLLTALPFFVRNFILSGWLLYPATFFNLFNPDWQIPRGVAEYDFREIQVWGRGYTDVTKYELPMREWIRPWFTGQSRVDQLFILAAAVTGVLLLVMLFSMCLRRKWAMADWLLPLGTVSLCFYFWLGSAPLIRYGCVYVWLAPVLTFGYLYFRASVHFDKYVVLYFALALLGGYKFGTFGTELLRMLPADQTEAYLLLQKDYENYPTEAYDLHGVTFYYAESGDQTGYEDFPAAPVRVGDIFRGETLAEGFRAIISEG